MKTFRYIGLFILTLSLGFCFSYLVVELSSTKSVSQVIVPYSWLLMGVRYSIYALTLLIWPAFIKVIAKRRHWPTQTIARLSNRLNLCILFGLIELFLVYNLPGHLITWMFHHAG